MRKPKLDKILEFIINEDNERATKQLHNWLVARTAELNEDEDKNDITDVKSDINSEEEHSVSEAEQDINDIVDNQAEEEVQDGDLDIDPDNAASVAKENLDPNEVNYQFTDIQKDLERLKKEFDKINGNDTDVTEDDLATDITGTDDVDSDDEEPGELSEEEEDESKYFQDGYEAGAAGMKTKYNPYPKGSWKSRVWLRGYSLGELSTMQESKEFTHDMDSGAYDEGANAADRGLDKSDNPYEEGTTEYKSWIEGFDKKEDDLSESLFSDSDLEELIEACDLTDVVSPVKNVDGEEIGKGGKISQNDKSPIGGSKDASKREESAKPIEIKSSDNDSFAREKSPETKDAKFGNVRNRPNVSKVPNGGDPKAELNNKGNGFGKENAPSPIPGKKG